MWPTSGNVKPCYTLRKDGDTRRLCDLGQNGFERSCLNFARHRMLDEAIQVVHDVELQPFHHAGCGTSIADTPLAEAGVDRKGAHAFRRSSIDGTPVLLFQSSLGPLLPVVVPMLHIFDLVDPGLQPGHDEGLLLLVENEPQATWLPGGWNVDELDHFASQFLK